MLGECVCVVNFKGWWLFRKDGHILGPALQILYADVARNGPLHILRSIGPPILDAAFQDFNFSKFCAI